MAFNSPRRLCIISTQTASASASLSFTSKISSNFTTYYVKVRNLIAATNVTNLLLTFSTDNGSNYLSTNYKYAFRTVNSSAGTSTTSSDSASSIIVCDTCSSTSTRPINVDIMFYNLNDSTYCCKCVNHAAFYNSSASAVVQVGGGMNTGTTAVNAIKFAMSSGNITSGTITLYGCVDGGFLY